MCLYDGAYSFCDNVTIDARNGQLSTTTLIDREEKDLIECDVTATDNGNPPRSSTTSVRNLFVLMTRVIVIVTDIADSNQRYRCQR